MATTEVTTYNDAFARLAEDLVKDEQVQVGSFWEFLRDVWSLSFEHPEYFKAWHIGVIAEDIEECLESGLNYCAVLPRFHFKSTVLGHAFSIWRLLKSKRDCSVLYLSYSDGMSQYHLAEINKAVRRNPVLEGMLQNRSPKADFSFRYKANKRNVEIMHGGLFSFKRGMHVNGALIADDVLRDPDNPLNAGQITKVEDHFMTESLFIPLKGVPVIVLGTPMMPGDLLSKLQEDERFKSRVLPALDPVPNRRVLMPELYDEKWLLSQQEARPKSFASEFMLIPHFSTEAYFEEEDIRKCEDATLRSFPYSRKYEGVEGEQLFAGFDVGKKRHPSHLVIFRRRGDKLEQIHQSWLDGWNYSDQIEFLNEVAKNFKLDKGYIDNTRGELEDRGLDHRWWPMSFTAKSKNTMAQIFEEYVHSDRLRLLRDERQRLQILSVNNELKAPVTPLGHGDAFFSISMALQAAYETEMYKVVDLGNFQDWMEDISPIEDTPEDVGFNKKVEAQKAADPLDRERSLLEHRPTMDYTSTVNVGLTKADSPNPACLDELCRPSFWVPKKKLCIYCGFRG